VTGGHGLGPLEGRTTHIKRPPCNAKSVNNDQNDRSSKNEKLKKSQGRDANQRTKAISRKSLQGHLHLPPPHQRKSKPLCKINMVFVLGILSIITSVAAMGRVPDGLFSSDEATAETVKDAMEYCDTAVSCAGMTYRPNEDEEEEHDWTVHFHSFIPPLLNNSKEHDWVTERSHKAFVFHPGKLVSNSLLDLGMDPATLSLDQVMETCKNHTECVAFSYPVESSHLNGFDEILFASSVESLDEDMDNWHSFVINEETRAAKANAEVLWYDEDLKEKPYNTCCEEASAESLPSIEDVRKMDTLPRISCEVSREDFLAKYEFTRTPVILVGCDEEWPAKIEWTMEKLTERFGNDTETTWRTKTVDTPGDWVEATWMEMVNERDQNKSVYIFDPLEASATKLSIDNDYIWPKPLIGKDLYPLDFPPGFGSRRWFCLGEKGSGTVPHSDPFGSDAWNS